MASYGYEDGMGAAAWQLACSRLSERGAHVLQSAQWSDCVLVVGRERREMRAHRLLLAMASPVLAHMLYVEWSLERSDPVPIPELEPDTFRAMLLYIYTERVEIASHSAARDLYYAAQRYSLPHLVAACSAHLGATLFPANVCATLELVEVLGDDERLDAPLREQCLQLMRDETAQVLGDDSFLSARPRTVTTLFALEPLEIRSEMELFQAAERYAAHRISTGGVKEAEVEAKQALRGALHNIRFLTLESVEFAEHDVSSLLSAPEQLAIVNNILSANTHHHMPSGFSESRTHRHKTRQQLERKAAETGDEMLRRWKKEGSQRLAEEAEREEEAERKVRETRQQLERKAAETGDEMLRRWKKEGSQRLAEEAEREEEAERKVRETRQQLERKAAETGDEMLRRWKKEGSQRLAEEAEREEEAERKVREFTHTPFSGLSELSTRCPCTARGRVRVLRGDGAGEGVEQAFDHTFAWPFNTSVIWWEFMSWGALQALVAEPGADVTDQFTVEVELAADPLKQSEHNIFLNK